MLGFIGGSSQRGFRDRFDSPRATADRSSSGPRCARHMPWARLPPGSDVPIHGSRQNCVSEDARPRTPKVSPPHRGGGVAGAWAERVCDKAPAPWLLGVLNDGMALSDWLAPGERPRGSLRGGSEERKVFRHAGVCPASDPVLPSVGIALLAWQRGPAILTGASPSTS